MKISIIFNKLIFLLNSKHQDLWNQEDQNKETTDLFSSYCYLGVRIAQLEEQIITQMQTEQNLKRIWI